MNEEDIYKTILTSLIQKQMLLVGKKDAVVKARGIDGLKINDQGKVLEIKGNLNEIFDSVLVAFTTFSGLVAAKQIIEAKSEQAKQVREQIASGWLQIQREKSHLTSALEFLSLGMITTNQELQTVTVNPAVERILGTSKSGKWTVNEIQINLKGEFFLPLACKKCMDLLSPLPPEEVMYKEKKLKVFISPIKTFNRGTEEFGVTVILEELN